LTPTIEPTSVPTEAITPTEKPTATPTAEISATPTVELTPTIEPTNIPTEEPTAIPTVEITSTPTEVPTATPTAEISITPTKTPIVTLEPTPTQSPSPWTFEKVELNKEYQNSGVTLTFTKLPDPSGNIKIEEITLTGEQIKQTGSLSDKAYDITSDMKDGDFSYNLSLPIPESSKGKAVEVKFAEEISNIGTAEKVDNTLTKTDTSVSVTSLDHFTIFVVVSPTQTGGVCVDVAGATGSDKCFNTIQAAINAATGGETITIAAGTYVEAVTVDKKLTLTGVGSPTATSFTLNSGADLTGSTGITASTINVNSGAKIQDGILLAASGGTVNVAAGNYTEQITINKSLDLIGAGEATTTILAPNTISSTFTNGAGEQMKPVVTIINGVSVNISQLKIDGVGKGNVNNQFVGIGLYNAGGSIDHVTITNIKETPLNGDQGGGDAIYAYNEDGSTRTLDISTSTISNYQKNGMTLKGAGLSVDVSGNTVTGEGLTGVIGQNGIQVSDGATGTITYNQVSGHVYTGNDWWAAGILIYRSDNISILHNTLSADQADIYITQGSNNTVGDNTITGNSSSQAGVMVSDRDDASHPATDNTVNHNTITGGWAGIWTSYASDNTYSNNIISDSFGNGIYSWDSDGNTFSGNNISGIAPDNGGWGIALDGGDTSGTIGSDSNTVSNNTVETSDVGIWVGNGSDNNTFTGNSLSDNSTGVQVETYFYVVLPPAPTGLQFHTNSFTGSTIKEFTNSTSVAVDATNNWWGSANPTFESIVSGTVSYSPWWMNSAMTLPSTLIAVFDGIHTTLEGLNIANNIDTCSTHPNTCSNLYFEKSISGVKMGRITFTASLDLTSDATQTFLQNLGTYMEANAGSMKFDATTQAGMKAAGAEIKMYGLNALGYTDITPIIVKDDAGNILSEGDTNYPTLSDISYAAGDGGTLIFKTSHFTQFDLPSQDQTTPDGSGNAGLSGDTTEVVLTDPDQAVEITIASGTVDPTIDVSAFITLIGGKMTGTLPEITINSDVADVVIPDGTVVTGPADWDGIIQAPISGTPTGGNAPAGFSVGSTVISVGSPDGTLTFDTAVTIVLPGVTGTVGYRPSGSDTWYTITTCGGSYDTPTLPTAPGECAINNGTDTKIVTYHFTSFGSLTTNSSSSSNSGGTTSASAPVCNDTKPGSAPVLLSAVAGTNSVTLTWSVASDPTSYYLVTYGNQPGAQQYGNPNVGPAGTTSYTVNNLSGNTRYYFRVRAGNGCMPGDFSNELSALPQGQFIANPATGFEPGVLGEQTTANPTITGTPTPTKESVSIGNILGSEKTAPKGFDWRWLWLLLIPAVWVVRKFSSKKS